jgi:hypothetical protein
MHGYAEEKGNMHGDGEERGIKERAYDVTETTCLIMHKREGDCEGDMMFCEEHAWLCRRRRGTMKET